MQKTFLVSFDLQRDEIEAFCFRECGKISIGSVSLEIYEGLPEMYFLPCNHSVCPYLDRQVDEPCAEVDNVQFHLRKLSSLATVFRTQVTNSGETIVTRKEDIPPGGDLIYAIEDIEGEGGIAGEGDAPACPALIDAIKQLGEK